ncbi:MAG: aminodeoxychorismate/anthranilate synthase component II [Saprospiraceae bacterium]|jgi:anthranilate synthase component 2|nr:aminodeoxychorismate/anthranilate synthase component II [Saprospiraceae bacterium]
MKVLMLDNYDSFTYNLVQYLEEIIDNKIDVYRNDQITLKEVGAYDTIILSPGPGVPKDAGILMDVINEYATTKNIFGVCLGMQAIGESFGGGLANLEKVHHGVQTLIIKTEDEEPIFKDVPTAFEAGRYHSWVVEKEKLPDCLQVTAIDKKGIVMAISHKEYNVRGVQFHPESVMTPDGKTMLRNFINYSNNLKKEKESTNETYTH